VTAFPTFYEIIKFQFAIFILHFALWIILHPDFCHSFLQTGPLTCRIRQPYINFFIIKFLCQGGRKRGSGAERSPAYGGVKMAANLINQEKR
jgi:hypothetical protein